MNEFLNALHSDSRSDKIPEDRDIFGALIGEWAIVWMDHLGTAQERKVPGEWIFSRVLDGSAVQDVFIVPSRDERRRHPQPDAEYGTTIRQDVGIYFMAAREKHTGLPVKNREKS